MCLLTFSHYTRPHLEYEVYVKNKLGYQIYLLVYKFNICFITLANLVYQNNPSCNIYNNTMEQSSIQHATIRQK